MNPFSLDHIPYYPSVYTISFRGPIAQARRNHGASYPFPNMYVKELKLFCSAAAARRRSWAWLELN